MPAGPRCFPWATLGDRLIRSRTGFPPLFFEDESRSLFPPPINQTLRIIFCCPRGGRSYGMKGGREGGNHRLRASIISASDCKWINCVVRNGEFQSVAERGRFPLCPMLWFIECLFWITYCRVFSENEIRSYGLVAEITWRFKSVPFNTPTTSLVYSTV